MDRAPIEVENARLRELLKRSRIHLESAARVSARQGAGLVSAEVISLAREIRAAIGEPPSNHGA